MVGRVFMTRKDEISARSQSGVTLIELIVAVVIMGVLSTMILTVWFSLQSSFASTEQNAEQRDSARQAVWRIADEIRDAQGVSGNAPITSANANSIIFSTSFNNAGALSQPPSPSATDASVHRLKIWYDPSSKKVFRVEDTDNNGSFAGETSVQLLSNVVNGTTPSTEGGVTRSYTPLFRYSYYDDAGVLQTVDSMADAGVDTSRVLNVQIRALVDIKPNKSPVYMDLRTTVQPRNAAR
jgi:prepilin-type N-terminal cleavage/methylation domain-containing protein